jgi:hypothetical protein
MSDLKTLIAQAISMKEGNKELALFYHPTGNAQTDWSADLGNPSRHVNLGESVGEFRSDCCSTPEAAVQDLIEQLRQHQQGDSA